MVDPSSNQPDVEPLDRIQILAAMGITAIALLIVSRLLLLLDSAYLVSIHLTGLSVLTGAGLGAAIAIASGVIYQIWEDYRRSADYYLNLVLRPLAWADLIWLGLLPGLSEELLFRGVMIPLLGFNLLAVLTSSIFFGVLHFSGSQHWSYVVWATVIGFVLGMSALMTGNLLIPITAHITTNLISSMTWKAKMAK